MGKHLWKGIPVVILIVFGLLIFFIYNSLVSQYEAEIEALHNQKDELLTENREYQNEINQYIEEIEALHEQALENSGIEDSGKAGPFEYEGLVEIREMDSTIEVDLKYATPDNFTGEVLYQLEVCLLLKPTAEKLVAANAEFAEEGYRLKIWDAYRPKSAQHVMWEHSPDGVYVADPAVGSNHNRGASVDVTLVDQNGREVEMPTGFDDFTEEASRNYPDMPEEARKNMEYLTEVMVRNGFSVIQSEWWHFNDADYKEYPHLDLSLEDWVNQYFSSIE